MKYLIDLLFATSIFNDDGIMELTLVLLLFPLGSSFMQELRRLASEKDAVYLQCR
jgi:hypothetical protein